MSFFVEGWPDLLLFEIHNKIIHSISLPCLCTRTAYRVRSARTFNNSLLYSCFWSPTQFNSSRRRRRRLRLCGLHRQRGCWAVVVVLHNVRYSKPFDERRRTQLWLTHIRTTSLLFLEISNFFSLLSLPPLRRMNMHDLPIYTDLSCSVSPAIDDETKDMEKYGKNLNSMPTAANNHIVFHLKTCSGED